ncbi:MAG: hypothetical protein ACMG6E_00030 [Candidatus Roizmanbacteria bacterium]
MDTIYSQLLTKICAVLGMSADENRELFSNFDHLTYQAFLELFLDTKEVLSDSELDRVKSILDEEGNVRKDGLNDLLSGTFQFLPAEEAHVIYVKSCHIAFSQILAIVLENSTTHEKAKIEELISAQRELKELFS